VGFLKRLLGREEEGANPFGSAAPAPEADVSTPVVSFQSHPMEASWSSVTINGQRATPEQAQAFTQAFEQLGNVANLGSSQVVDLRGVPGLREKVLGAMRNHPDDPAAMQSALLDAFKTVGAPAPKPAEGDPLDRLKKLDELRDQGLLTDAEFAEQKKKLLDEL
jgi:Short C-terminal domain